MNTLECVLTDMLDCGYADLEMLSVLYSTIGDEVLSNERETILKDATQNGGINYALFEAYYYIKDRVADEIQELLDEYSNADDKENTDIAYELANIMYDNKNKFKPLKKKQLKEMYTNLEEFRNTKPYCNCLDTSFQNDLDQVFDEDSSARDNAIEVIKYWLN